MGHIDPAALDTRTLDRIVRSLQLLARLGTCHAELAYRSMADIGTNRRCGAKVFADGYCKRHHPDHKPARDSYGRIVKRGSN